MKIPRQFRLLGHTITVEYDPALYCKEERYGEAHYDTLKITLQSPAEGYPLERTMVEHAFLHELTHMILYTQNRHELNADEQFVDVFSGLLHQALTSGLEG